MDESESFVLSVELSEICFFARSGLQMISVSLSHSVTFYRLGSLDQLEFESCTAQADSPPLVVGMQGLRSLTCTILGDSCIRLSCLRVSDELLELGSGTRP